MRPTFFHTVVVSLALQVTIFLLGGPADSISRVAAADTGRGYDIDDVRRIDVHAHFVPPFYREVLLEKNLASGGSAIPPWNASFHLEEQSKYDVKMSVLSISAPGVVFFERNQVAERRHLTRRLNDYGRELSVAYPGQFQFFATLTLPDVDGAVDEAVYSLDVLKAAGVIMFGNSNGLYLGDKVLDPLMEVLNDRSAVAFVHPNALNEDSSDLGIPPFILDFLLDTSRAATNLVVRNVTGRYPKIKWLLAHSGGFLPFAAGRVSMAYSQILKNTTVEDILERLKTFYVEVGYTGSSQLPSVMDFLPGERILFGSDFPSQPEGLGYVTSILNAFPLTVQRRYDINFSNAVALFGESLLEGGSAPAKDPEQEETRGF